MEQTNIITRGSLLCIATKINDRWGIRSARLRSSGNRWEVRQLEEGEAATIQWQLEITHFTYRLERNGVGLYI